MVPFYRATTPKHTFVFEVDPDATFKSILITYVQKGAAVLEKTKDDLTFEGEVEIEPEKEGDEPEVGYAASLRLTQEESKRFSDDRKCGGGKVYIQVRALTMEDEAVVSDEFVMDVRDVLNDRVME